MSLCNSFKIKDASRLCSKMAMTALATLTLSVTALQADTKDVDSNAALGGMSEVQEHTTPAGYNFWYYPMPNAARTALAIDWAQEVPLSEGTHPAVAIVGLEVMLKGGAGGRGAADIVADYEDLDAGSGLWVRPRGASGYIVAPDKHWPKAREIAHQVLTEPAFEQRWFDREHQIMIESAIDDRSDSWGMGWILAREVFMGDHPYNKFWSLNDLDEFKVVTLDDVKTWYKSSFSTKTAIIAAAGSADAATIAKEIDLLFAGLPSNAVAKPIKVERPSAPGKTILLHKPDAPKSVVLLAGNFPADSQAHNTALQLGVGVLGYGKNSRLFKTVRAGMGATYGFGADVHNVTQEHRMLTMSGEIETAKLQEALSEIEQAYTKFRKSGIGRIEFPVAKRFYKREFKKDLERPINVAFAIVNGVQKSFSADYMNTTLSRVDSLDRDDVNSLIADSFPAYEDILKLIVSPNEKAVEGACVITKIEEAKSCL